MIGKRGYFFLGWSGDGVFRNPLFIGGGIASVVRHSGLLRDLSMRPQLHRLRFVNATEMRAQLLVELSSELSC
jgi:hypothetical protein